MLTRDTLNRLHELTDAFQQAQEYASEHLRTAKDRYNDRVHTITRNGAKVNVSERELWEELFLHPNGTNSEAGKILRKKHPEVFKAYERQDKAAEELRTFCLTELNVDFTKMTVSDYLRLSEQLFALLISEQQGESEDNG